MQNQITKRVGVRDAHRITNVPWISNNEYTDEEKILLGKWNVQFIWMYICSCVEIKKIVSLFRIKNNGELNQFEIYYKINRREKYPRKNSLAKEQLILFSW